MPVDPYQPFTNRVTGETFRCVSNTEDAYVTEWTVEPGGFVPFEHVHLAQDEVFHVQAGELRVVINGRAQVVGEGQSITVPCGARQTGGNNSQSDVLQCVLEYRPALDSYSAFQCFGGLTLDGCYWRKGVVNPAKMMYLMQKMGTRSVARPALLPTPVFRILMKVCYWIGEALGWEQLYYRYVG